MTLPALPHTAFEGHRLLARGALGLGHGMRRGVAGYADFHVQSYALAEMLAQHGLEPDPAFAFGQRLDGHAQDDRIALHASPFALASQFGG
ncbi:MAG: hypothetical protein E2602_06485 [Achromobacter sp.]|nr:hypothetical protein [Achromobacter sp.]